MFPLLAFVFALRERSSAAWFALFVTGFSIMDVSLYMRDAPVRALPLITRDNLGHDWHKLLRGLGMLNFAGTFADIAYFLGALCTVASIGIGLYLALMSYVRPSVPASSMFRRTLDKRVQKQIDEKRQQWKST